MLADHTDHVIGVVGVIVTPSRRSLGIPPAIERLARVVQIGRGSRPASIRMQGSGDLGEGAAVHSRRDRVLRPLRARLAQRLKLPDQSRVVGLQLGNLGPKRR